MIADLFRQWQDSSKNTSGGLIIENKYKNEAYDVVSEQFLTKENNPPVVRSDINTFWDSFKKTATKNLAVGAEYITTNINRGLNDLFTNNFKHNNEIRQTNLVTNDIIPSHDTSGFSDWFTTNVGDKVDFIGDLFGTSPVEASNINIPQTKAQPASSFMNMPNLLIVGGLIGIVYIISRKK